MLVGAKLHRELGSAQKCHSGVDLRHAPVRAAGAVLMVDGGQHPKARPQCLGVGPVVRGQAEDVLRILTGFDAAGEGFERERRDDGP